MADIQAYEPGPPMADTPADWQQVYDRLSPPDDAETVEVTPDEVGPAVDPPVRPVTFADVVSRADERRPIVPASLRSRTGRQALLTLTVAMASHGILWQLSRTPLYLAKTAWYAPQGAIQALCRPVRWASAEEGNWHLRQQAANSNDPATWLALDARRADAPWLFQFGAKQSP